MVFPTVAPKLECRSSKISLFHQNITNLRPSPTMALKRKSAPTIHEQPKSKAIKVQAGSDKSSENTAKKLNTSKIRVAEESSEGEEIDESGEGDAEEEVESDSDTLDNISDDDEEEFSDEEEDGEDALDDQDEDDEDAMDIDNAEQKSKTKSDNSEIAVKETPAHAAQRALAKERKLSRPNGTPIRLSD
jgi:hypothetical protein